MYKIFKNISSENDIKETIRYFNNLSKKIPILKSQDNLGEFLYQRLTYNQIMSSNSIKDILFNETLIKKIKETIGDFYFINYVHGKINSFGTNTHRDGQSFGYNYDGIKKSSNIIKVLFYFNKDFKEIPDGYGLDINLFDINLKNIFLSKKIFMKLNYYYENYLNGFKNNILSRFLPCKDALI